MADEMVVDEAVCPTCKTGLTMTEQGGPFGSDVYTCPTCSTRYKYQTPPPSDWEPPLTKG